MAVAIGNEVSITRVFDVPREIVWKAWTDPDRFMRWWGPKSFTSPSCSMDFRIGGKYLFCMRTSEGKDYWTTGTYREIVPLGRIVYSDSFADKNGNVVPATHYGFGPDFPLERIVTVVFEEYEGRTKFTLHHKGLPSGEESRLAGVGWNESFDKLANTLT